MMTSEEELVQQIREGNAEILGKYIELKRKPLLAFITKSLSDSLKKKIEPEDILSEVSINAVKSLDDVDLSKRDPFNWLCQLAERRIIDAHRHYFGAQKRDAGKELALQQGDKKGNQKGLIDLLVASMTTPSQAFSRNQREFKLQEAMAQLSEEQASALRLRYMQNLPTKEIAEQLGKSDGSVRVMLTRTLNKLQELLEDDDSFQAYQS